MSGAGSFADVYRNRSGRASRYRLDDAEIASEELRFEEHPQIDLRALRQIAELTRKGWSRSTFKKSSPSDQAKETLHADHRLQLALIPEVHHGAQRLPADVRERCV